MIMTVLLKEKNKEGREGDDKERKILCLEHVEKSGRRLEFRASKMEF